jgi:uncharacterized protein (TIGR03083 family)
MTDRLAVLEESVQHLRDVAAGIDPVDYTASAYPSEWTVADTFSHLGSGAVIGKRRFEDIVADREVEPAFNSSVWEVWNAKDPAAQVADSLASDAAYLSTLKAATDEQRQHLQFTMGPFTYDFDGLVGLRLNEHVLHTWDIEVPFNPRATLANVAANAVLDRIQFVVLRTGKPTGEVRTVTVRTVEPARDFTIALDPDSVNLVEAGFEGSPELEIPAEALVRLIYGRLDVDNDSAVTSSESVSYLRGVFPGL